MPKEISELDEYDLPIKIKPREISNLNRCIGNNKIQAVIKKCLQTKRKVQAKVDSLQNYSRPLQTANTNPFKLFHKTEKEEMFLNLFCKTSIIKLPWYPNNTHIHVLITGQFPGYT